MPNAKGEMQKSAPAAILGVAYDASSSYLRGSARAPASIREALVSRAGNSASETLVDISAPGVLVDAGDVTLDDSNPRDSIQCAVQNVLESARPILLGGDHSITYPSVRAISQKFPRLTVLHVDAHSDLYDEFEGDRYSHACPFARVMEENLAVRLVQVGIRAMTQHQRHQADRFGVEVIDMRAWADGVRPAIHTSEMVYLSIDIDGIDRHSRTRRFSSGAGRPHGSRSVVAHSAVTGVPCRR